MVIQWGRSSPEIMTRECQAMVQSGLAANPTSDEQSVTIGALLGTSLTLPEERDEATIRKKVSLRGEAGMTQGPMGGRLLVPKAPR
jgi:hypothetical protein